MQQLERKTLTLHEKFKAFILHLELCVCLCVWWISLELHFMWARKSIPPYTVVSAAGQALNVVLYLEIIHLGSRWNDDLICVHILSGELMQLKSGSRKSPDSDSHLSHIQTWRPQSVISLAITYPSTIILICLTKFLY